MKLDNDIQNLLNVMIDALDFCEDVESLKKYLALYHLL